MNIDLIRSAEYKELFTTLVTPYSWKKAVSITDYPFDEQDYRSEYMANEPSLNNFNLISKINVLYDIDQYIYGVLNLDGFDYIVSVDNEFTINVVGDTETNWLYRFFFPDNLDKFELFMQECQDKLGIVVKQPDFEKFSKIDNDVLDPLIFGNWQP